MKIALVCPTLPPDHCGVGDYTANLATALAGLGAWVRIWTSCQDADATAGTERIRIQRVAGPWRRGALRAIRDQLREARPDAVVIQYTPQLWGPESLGVRPDLVPWLAELRRELAGAPVTLTAHELNYPAGLSPRGLLLGFPQLFQLLVLAARADRVFFTYEAAMESTLRYLPWRRDGFSVLPVGSNISPVRPVRAGSGFGHDEEGLRCGAGITADQPILLHFGGMHPTHQVGHMLRALDAVLDFKPEPVLVFIGVSREALMGRLAELRMSHLAPRIHGLGYLAAPEVSRWLQESDRVLAPFLDGVSTRRGSYMAALAHGRSVITTRGWATSPSIPWHRFSIIPPDGSADAFAAAVADSLARPEEALRKAAQGRSFYEERFSWSRIASELLDKLASSSGSRSMTPEKNQKNAASGL